MPDYTLRAWIARQINVRQRLERVCACYLLFLMVVTTKHTLEEAARFSGLHKSQFSNLLKYHPNIAVYTLESLSKQQAKRLAKSLQPLKSLPWRIVLIIDSTLQNRSSLHPENSKKFNHGNGFVMGHQWTNIVLIINDSLIPLRPIPFYSKRYCVDHGREYQTEHELVVDYITQLNLEDYIGSYDPRDVLVLTDSGYDHKKIEIAIAEKQWTFIIALRKNRSVKSESLYLTTPKSKQWSHVATFFRNHRRLKWTTIRMMTNGAKAKRMEFRIRHTMAYLRYVGQVQLVCSEPKKRPEGRRRYFACNDVKVTARQIMLGYRLRWAVGVSREGHINPVGESPTEVRSSSLVAWEAPWREIKTVEPSDTMLFGACAKHQVVTCSERRRSLVTRSSGGRAALLPAKAARIARTELETTILTGGVSAATWCDG